MNCLSLYNSLFVRESAESYQYEAAKAQHADQCCFEKCKLCKFGMLDATATVNINGFEQSCKNVVAEGSQQCEEECTGYASACCMVTTDNPCRMCPAGYEVDGDVMVDFYGEMRSCEGISNRLSLSEEAGSSTCSISQNDFASQCCFERCPICPDGYNLNWEVDVEYNRGTVACGEFDGIIRGNGIEKGTEECSSLRSTYSSACCYNYATASGGRYASETTVAQVTTAGYLSTNLDTSDLSQRQKEEAKNLVENLIRTRLRRKGCCRTNQLVMSLT